MKQKTLILDALRTEQKLRRIAYEILENNFEETEIVIVGIAKRGAVIAKKICDIITNIQGAKVTSVTLTLPPELHHGTAKLSQPIELLKDKSIVIVDDVLNSGKTLIYATRHLLTVPTKKIHTAVLVDRRHRKYPVRADFAGLTLSTTLQEHISVEFTGPNGDLAEVYLT
jgi:pyrimidine operon attenuation protein / uracil phosphoribosyltransferase